MTQQPQALGEILVDDLDSLRKQLIDISERLERSGVERTNGLRSIMGRDCDFYRRSLDLLLRKDYIDLKNLIKSCNDTFNLIEGNNGQR